MLLLPFECSCVQLVVFLSVFIHSGLCLQHLKMIYSDYVILVYYHCKSCVQIACSVTNVGIAKFLPRYKETGSKPGMGCVTKITASK